MEQLKTAIMKVALGFSISEVTEEYDAKDGELRLVKRKETRKEVPPDLKALKLLMEGGELEDMTDEELEALKARLIKEWKEEES